MEIKMIAVDLDDTLLRNDKTVSDRTISALEKCRDKGIKIIYATARGQSTQEIVLPDLFDGCAKMCGAIAYAGETLVYSKLISTVDSRDLMLAADNAGIDFAAELEGWHYANFDVAEKWGWKGINGFEISDFSTLDLMVEKLYALPESEPEIELIKSYLPEGLYHAFIRGNISMIMHDDATKYRAVRALAEFWGISSSEIVAFGDDFIDIDMVQYCGIGIAMENAIDEVKSVADYICDTNENDGIAKWLEEHVL